MLVALVAVLLSTFTALAARTLLLTSIDQQLDGVSTRALRGDPGGQRGPRDQLLIPGQPPGTLAAAVASNGSGRLGQIIASDGQLVPMPAVSLDAIAGLDVDRGKQTVTLPGLGRYRLVGRKVNVITSDGVTEGQAFWGIPLELVDHQLAQLIGLETVLTGLAIGGAVVALADRRPPEPPPAQPGRRDGPAGLAAPARPR